MRKLTVIFIIVAALFLTSCSKGRGEKTVPFEAVMKTYQNLGYFEGGEDTMFPVRIFSTNKYETVENVQLFGENEVEVEVIDTSISTNDKTGYFLDSDIDKVYEYFFVFTIANKEAEITKMKLSLDGEVKEFDIGLVKVTKLSEEYKSSLPRQILLLSYSFHEHSTVYKEERHYYDIKSNSNNDIIIKSVEVINDAIESYSISINDQPIDQYDKKMKFEDVLRIKIQLKYNKYLQSISSCVIMTYEIEGNTYTEYMLPLMSDQVNEYSKYDFER